MGRLRVDVALEDEGFRPAREVCGRKKNQTATIFEAAISQRSELMRATVERTRRVLVCGGCFQPARQTAIVGLHLRPLAEWTTARLRRRRKWRGCDCRSAAPSVSAWQEGPPQKRHSTTLHAGQPGDLLER